jgi:hypothetical protein
MGSSADGLIDSTLQQQLLRLLTDDEASPVPPSERWEQRTVDDARNPHPSWGCRDYVLGALKHQPAMIEVHTRLKKLYPDLKFYHMPADDMQVRAASALHSIESWYQACCTSISTLPQAKNCHHADVQTWSCRRLTTGPSHYFTIGECRHVTLHQEQMEHHHARSSGWKQDAPKQGCANNSLPTQQWLRISLFGMLMLTLQTSL